MSDDSNTLDLSSGGSTPQDSFQAAIAHETSNQSSFDPEKAKVRKTSEERASAATAKHIVTRESSQEAGEGLLDEIAKQESIITPEKAARYAALKAGHSLDSYNPALVSKMAVRFGLDSSDLLNPKIAKMLKGKIDADLHIQRLTKGVGTSDQDADADEEEGEESEKKSKKDDSGEDEDESEENSERRDLDLEAARKRAEEANQQPAPRNREEAFQQWHSSMLEAVKDPTLNDPIAVGHFKNLLADSFGANSPESLAVVDQLGDNMIAGGMSLISSIVPHVLRSQFAQVMEEFAPGFLEAHQEAALHNSWADVIASEPGYRELPQEFNSPEWVEMATQVLKANPWLETIQFPGVSYREALVQRGQILARLAMGEKLSPASIAKAFEDGKKQAQHATRKVTAGRLGAGKRASAMGEFGSKDPDSAWREDFRRDILAHNRNQRSTD